MSNPNDAQAALKNTPLLNKILTKYLGAANKTSVLKKYNYNSVIDIAKTDCERFIIGLNDELSGKAKEIYQESESYAAQILQSHRAITRQGMGGTGIVSRKIKSNATPTWQDEFMEPWEEYCKPGAIGAIDSATAYLVDLSKELEDIEKFADADALKLDIRRPDLANLILNETNLHQEIPMIELVNEILFACISHHLKTGEDVYETLAKTRYSFTLPYDKWMTIIDKVLNAHHNNLGALIQKADLAFPYFVSATYSPTRERAKLAATHFSEELQLILTEEPNEESILKTFQSSNIEELLDSLKSIKELLNKIGLNKEELQALLSRGAYKTVTSTNIPANSASSSLYFTSSGSTPITIENEHINGLEIKHLARMSQLIRLQKILDIPFDHVDVLIKSSLQLSDLTNININSATLKAIGLFKKWKNHYNVDAYLFSALIWHIPLHAIGSKIPMYDKLFDSSLSNSTNIPLNNQVFNYTDPSNLIVQQISNGLKINSIELEIVCREVYKFLNPKPAVNNLTYNHPIISSIHRLVTLPRLFGLTIIEGISILNLLNSIDINIVKCLIHGNVNSSSDTNLDIVGVLELYELLALWLKKNNISPLKLEQILGLSGDQPIMTQELQNFVTNLKTEIISKVIQDKKFTSLDLPTTDNNNSIIPWTNLLAPMFDKYGNINVPLVAKNSPYLDTQIISPGILENAILPLPGWRNVGVAPNAIMKNNNIKIITNSADSISFNTKIFAAKAKDVLELSVYDLYSTWPIAFQLFVPAPHSTTIPKIYFTLSKREFNKTIYTAIVPADFASYCLAIISSGATPNKDYIRFSAITLACKTNNQSIEETQLFIDNTINSLNLDEDVKEKIINQLVPLIKAADIKESIYSNISTLFSCDNNFIPLLFEWSEISIKQLLDQIFTLDLNNLTVKNPPNTNFLNNFYKIARYCQALKLLSLSNNALNMCVSAPYKVSNVFTDQLPLNLTSFYYLKFLSNLINKENISEEQIISYFLEANKFAPNNVECAQLLSKMIDWQITPIQQAFTNLSNKPVKDLRQLDWILRLKDISTDLAVSVNSILAIRNITNTSPTRSEMKLFANSLITSFNIDKDYKSSNLTNLIWGETNIFQERNGELFYLDEKGKITKKEGIHSIDNEKYYFNNDHSIVMGPGIKVMGGKKYYLKQNNALFTENSLTIDSKTYRFNSDHSIIIPPNLNFYPIISFLKDWRDRKITKPNLLKILMGEIDPYNLKNILTLLEIQKIILGGWAKQCSGGRFHHLCIIASYALDHPPQSGKDLMTQLRNESTKYPQDKFIKYVDDNFSGIDKDKIIFLNISLQGSKTAIIQWYSGTWSGITSALPGVISDAMLQNFPSNPMLFPEEVANRMKEQGVMLPLYDNEKDGNYIHVDPRKESWLN